MGGDVGSDGAANVNRDQTSLSPVPGPTHSWVKDDPGAPSLVGDATTGT